MLGILPFCFTVIAVFFAVIYAYLLLRVACSLLYGTPIQTTFSYLKPLLSVILLRTSEYIVSCITLTCVQWSYGALGSSTDCGGKVQFTTVMSVFNSVK